MSGSSTTPSETTGTSTFHVPDMTCGHCVASVRTALAKSMPGTPVEIDLNAQIVRVSGDATTARQSLTDAGFTPDTVAG